MSSKKVFNVKDKVFAKIRGYPAWPAIISGVKVDTPSRQRYNVYFYGTGERAECKSEELFPYEENKSKLGKPNKRKYFAEALLQIEDDEENSVFPDDDSLALATPSNKSHIEQESPKDESDEVEKSNESNIESEGKLSTDESTLSKGKKVVSSRKSLGLSISKGTKRKISDVKPEAPSKKSLSNKPKMLETLKLKERPRVEAIVLVEPLEDCVVERAKNGQQKIEQTDDKNVSANEKVTETPDKQSETLNTTESVLETSDVLSDSSKAVKSLSKIKNSPTSSSEISSTNSVSVGHVSRSGRKIKPKKYSDYENESEVPKRSRLSKENSKSSEKHNNETDTSSEQNYKTKDTNSDTRKISKSHSAASIPHINNSATKNLEQVNNEISEDSELPVAIKDLMVGALSSIETSWKKTGPKKITKIDLLHTEVDLLDYIHKLRIALRTDHADYEGALDLLEHIIELQINALMLKKHQEIVETIKQVTRYTGNAKEWNLNEEEIVLHEEKSTQIRRKAEIVFNKFISLFTVSDGQSFDEIFNKEVEDFFTKTKHLACDQIYGLTSDKDYEL
ncbi:hepatoma-derived growth factor-related protein 2-like [Rhopalosiphum maidis]|uniref:hepatoma-derived growth factor-related protein 2-like n=1 Tax=Rhopalosiphum maidis TaxID=43146 RepID=UPI000EFF9489|nr:hepatoma-derived growth factor-related protein 2-like [Rhopalosiphum maidis]